MVTIAVPSSSMGKLVLKPCGETMVTGTKVHQSSTICVNFSYSVRPMTDFKVLKLDPTRALKSPKIMTIYLGEMEERVA